MRNEQHEGPAAHTLRLLESPPGDPDWSMGYLDLLGQREQAGPSTGILQRLMRAELLTSIYEDYWRPALGRVMKGLSGPSMAEEVRTAIARLQLDAAGPGGAKTVLDVACGTGHFTRAFGNAAGRNGLAIGIDGSRPMLARAMERTSANARVTYVRGDAVSLPFGDATMDGLCCFAALHMFADAEAALDSFARVLQPGGRIVLLTSGRRDHEPAHMLDTLGGWVSGQRMFEQGEVAELLLARGFSDIVQDYHGVAQLISGRLTG